LRLEGTLRELLLTLELVLVERILILLGGRDIEGVREHGHRWIRNLSHANRALMPSLSINHHLLLLLE